MRRTSVFAYALVVLALGGCAVPEVLTQPPRMPTMPMPVGAALPLPAYALRSGEPPTVVPLAKVGPAPRLVDLPDGKVEGGGTDEIADLLASDPLAPRAGTFRLTDNRLSGMEGAVGGVANGVYSRQDGRWTRRSGNVYMHSDGSSTVRMGDAFFHSDGTWTRRSGNVILRSDGSSCSLSSGTALCQGMAGGR
jgi:hypothetical protein